MSKLDSLIKDKIRKLSYPNPGHRGLPHVHGGSRKKILEGKVAEEYEAFIDIDEYRYLKGLYYKKRDVKILLDIKNEAFREQTIKVLDSTSSRFLKHTWRISDNMDSSLDDFVRSKGWDMVDGKIISPHGNETIGLAAYGPHTIYVNDDSQTKILAHELGHLYSGFDVLSDQNRYSKIKRLYNAVHNLYDMRLEGSSFISKISAEIGLAKMGLRKESLFHERELLADMFAVFREGSNSQKKALMKSLNSFTGSAKATEELLGFEYP